MAVPGPPAAVRCEARVNNPQGDRAMKAVRFWISGMALWSASVGAGQQLWAQDGRSTNHASADSSPPLAARVDQLDQQIRILQRLRELAADSAAAAAKDKVTPTVSAKDGFSLKSGDGKYTLRFRGYLQSDGR